MPATSHTKPALIVLINIPLLFAFTCFFIYLFITEPDNRPIGFLAAVVLITGFISNLVTMYRQRVTLFDDRIEFQGLWDCGTIHRDDIKSISGVISTQVRMHNTNVHRLPHIRKLTPTLRQWFLDTDSVQSESQPESR